MRISNSLIAQSVERRTVNPQVPGSSPGRGANIPGVARRAEPIGPIARRDPRRPAIQRRIPAVDAPDTILPENIRIASSAHGFAMMTWPVRARLGAERPGTGTKTLARLPIFGCRQGGVSAAF